MIDIPSFKMIDFNYLLSIFGYLSSMYVSIVHLYYKLICKPLQIGREK